MENVKHVVHINTDIGKGCEFCHFTIGGDRFAESVNHYIEAHGFRLLHVGQETVSGENSPVAVTAAVLGK